MTDEARGAMVHKAIWGVILIGLGVLFFLESSGLAEIGGVGRFWPLILIALGTAKLLTPRRERERGSGMWLLLVGICGLMINFDVLGLTWSTAWPLFIVAAGVSMMWQALVHGRRRDEGGDSHVG